MALAFGGIDGVTTLFLEYPELRKYFYGSAELTDELRAYDSPISVRLATVAELLADALENALDAVRTFEAASMNTEDMLDYATFLLQHSPALRETLCEHPRWWPLLLKELQKLPAEHDQGKHAETVAS
jgi:hypothetical protein